jgi:hypothetical protein
MQCMYVISIVPVDLAGNSSDSGGSYSIFTIASAEDCSLLLKTIFKKVYIQTYFYRNSPYYSGFRTFVKSNCLFMD